MGQNGLQFLGQNITARFDAQSNTQGPQRAFSEGALPKFHEVFLRGYDQAPHGE